jgi:hypothetical protein
MPKVDGLDQELIDAVRANFAELRAAEPKVIAQLLGTKSVQPWYRQWKSEQKLAKAVPNDWAEVGLPGDIWEWAVDIKQQRTAARKAHAAKTEQLAREHKQRVDLADNARDAALQLTESPLMDLIEAGYDQLPLAAQASISSASSDEQRKELMGKAMGRYRAAKLAELFGGDATTFKPGQGPAKAVP